MTLVFDTSALSLLLDKENNESLLKALSANNYSSLSVPLVTDAEMRFGFSYGSKPAENLQNYKLFKKRFDLKLLTPNQDTTIIYADLASWCKKNGVSLSHNDLWIASTCIQNAGKLLTLDHDFARVPQLSLVELSI